MIGREGCLLGVGVAVGVRAVLRGIWASLGICMSGRLGGLMTSLGWFMILTSGVNWVKVCVWVVQF